MRKFLAEIGRADGDHDGVRAQHRVHRNYEIVAVLQIDEHPVAGPHAAGLLQVACKRFNLTQGLGVTQACALKMQQRFVRCAVCSGLEYRVQGGGRSRQAARHVRRPEFEVAGLHGAQV